MATENLSIPVSETLSFLRFDAKTKEFIKKVIEQHLSGDLCYELQLTDKKQTLIIKDDNEICSGIVFPLGLYGFYEKPEETPEEKSDEKTDETPEEKTDETPEEKLEKLEKLEKPDEPKETKETKSKPMVHHWTWIWSLPEDHIYRAKFNQDGLTKIKELQQQIHVANQTEEENPTNQLLNKTLQTIFDNANIFSEDSMINSYIESVLLERLALETVYNIMVDAEHNLYLALGVKDVVWYNPVRKVDIVPANEDDE
jgi:hypothetical protein